MEFSDFRVGQWIKYRFHERGYWIIGIVEGILVHDNDEVLIVREVSPFEGVPSRHEHAIYMHPVSGEPFIRIVTGKQIGRAHV